MLNDSGKKFLKNIIGSTFNAVKLAGDASSRIYYRVKSGDKSYILCYDPDFISVNSESYPFLIIQKLFFNAGIAVPEILHYDASAGFILQSDHGDELLLYIIEKSEAGKRMALYKKAIEEMIKIQGINGASAEIPFSISFDVEKLMFEFDFFIENTLKAHFGFSNDNETANLRKYLLDICSILYKPSMFVLCHRDYHSRNILYSGEKHVVIDFQDARMGLPQYDLASLIRDPYYLLSDDEHDELFDYYYKLSAGKKIHYMENVEFKYYYDIISFQRNIKAAGSYGYLTHVKEKKYFEKFIKSAILYASGYSMKIPELAPAMKIIMKAAGVK